MNNPLFGTFPEALNYSEKSTMLPLKMIGRERVGENAGATDS